MTTTINDTTPILSILADLASTDATFQNAAEAFAEAIGKAREAGIKSGDLDGRPTKGKWYVEIQTAVATVRLNPDELALWSDKSKASKNSPKNKLQMRVNSATKRIRDRLAELEAAAMTQTIAPEAETDAAKGAKGKPNSTKSFADICVGELQASFSRSHKSQASNAPEAIDHEAFRGHLQAAADIFGKTMKVPTLPK